MVSCPVNPKYFNISKQSHSKERLTLLGPIHEILVLTSYDEQPASIVHADYPAGLEV